MATIDDLHSALIKADAAGDVAGAKALADHIRAVIAPAPVQSVDPTDGMSGFQKFAAGAGKAVYDVGRGAGQMLGIVSQKDIDEARRLDGPLMNTGAGTAGNIVGNVAIALPTAFIPGVNTVTGGAAVGAGLSALQPTSGDDSRLRNMTIGAIGGAALPAATGIFKTAKAALYDPLAGQNRIIGGALARSSGDQGAAIAQALRGQGAATPGVRLSAGQISGSEGLSALEDAISSQIPSGELARMGTSNRTALASALRDIAQSPEAMAAAADAREGAANSLYGKAFQSDAMRKSIAKDLQESTTGLYSAGGVAPTIDLGTEGLRNLADRPMFQKAVDQAKALAANKGQNIGNPLESLQGLHYIKLALDDMANPLAETAIGKNQLAAVNSIRESLTNELAQVSPLYGNARQTFSQMSQPINQMEVGRTLANKLIPSTAGDIPASLNYSSLATAMRDPDRLAQQATGFNGAKMAAILSPQQMGTVNGVTSDASKIAEALKRGMGTGSPTARRLAQGDMLAQHFAQEAPLTSKVLSLASNIPGVGLVGKGVSLAANVVGDKVQAQMLSKLDNMLANDPQGVAKLIEAELSRIAPSQRQQVIRALPGSVAAALPAALISSNASQ